MVKEEKIIQGFFFTYVFVTVCFVLLGNLTLNIFFNGILSVLIIIYCLREFQSTLFLRYFRILLPFVVFIAIHQIVYSDLELYYILSIANSIIIGYLIGLKFYLFPANKIFYSVSIIILFFIFFFTEKGNTDYLNRTIYTAILSILWYAAAYKDYLNGIRFDLNKLYLYGIISIFSYSRAGLGMSIIIFMGYFALKIYKVKRNQRLITVLSIIPIIIAGLLIMIGLFPVFDFLESTGSTGRFIERGLQSGRYIFWGWYFITMDVERFLIGEDQYSIGLYLDTLFEDGFSHTMHNSFIQLHSIAGLGALYLLGIFLINYFKLSYGDKVNKLFFSLVLLNFIVRASFDTIMFVQRYDYIFFGILFSIILINMKNENSCYL